MATLKSGLQFFIEQVEASSITEFVMHQYDLCVIGQTVGFVDAEHFCDDEEKEAQNEDGLTLLKYFGIKWQDLIGANNYSSLFASDEATESYYTAEQWKVISLFTAQQGHHMSREYWLKLAKEQLESMQ